MRQIPKIKYQRSNEHRASNTKDQSSKRKYFDLEERMTVFGEATITFCQKLEVKHVSRPIVTQLVRSVTSIGANYSEANNSSSRKDYRNKAYIAKKESQETEYWLRMLLPCFPEHKEKLRELGKEAHEFTLILQSITNKLDGRDLK